MKLKDKAGLLGIMLVAGFLTGIILGALDLANIMNVKFGVVCSMAMMLVSCFFIGLRNDFNAGVDSAIVLFLGTGLGIGLFDWLFPYAVEGMISALVYVSGF
jgi:hypothetical protein